MLLLLVEHDAELLRLQFRVLDALQASLQRLPQLLGRG